MFDQVKQALDESTDRVVTGFAHLLPGALALIIAVLISFLLAKLFAFLLRRSLTGVEFDRKVASWGWAGLAELSPSNSPTLLVVGFVYWGVILTGALIGVAAFDAAVTQQMVMRFFEYLPNFLAAILIVLFGNIVARFLARGVLIGAVNLNLPYARLLSLGVKWLMLVLTAAMALEHLEIGGKIVELAFAILFGGIVLALALAVGLGSKDLVSRSLEHQVVPREEEEEKGAQFHHL